MINSAFFPYNLHQTLSASSLPDYFFFCIIIYIFLSFFYPVVLGFLLNSVPQHKMKDPCCLIHTQNYFTFPATLPNDSYFIGSIFASASLKICAGLLHRLWLVINKNPPKAKAHRCCLR